MQLGKIILLLMFICFNFCVLAQNEVDTLSFLEQYKERISKTHINGFYIPTDVEDAMATMDEVLAPNLQETYKDLEEEKATKQVFFSLGTWMGQNWGLIEGSRYSEWLRNHHLSHPDDMIWANLLSYHRHLNNKPIRFEQIVKSLLEKRKKEAEERLKNAKIIKIDTLSKK